MATLMLEFSARRFRCAFEGEHGGTLARKHPDRHRESFLIDLVVAQNLHLAAEEVCGAAVSNGQHAAGVSICSLSRFR